MTVLEYKKWENFYKVIKSAMIACEASKISIGDHFLEVRKPIIEKRRQEKLDNKY